MQTGTVAVKGSPSRGARTAAKITQSPAGQGGTAALSGASQRLDLEAHYCAFLAAELHPDQVDGYSAVTAPSYQLKSLAVPPLSETKP
jgi:Cys-tRNA synthase (O-phospho-L-seryl-tRNA:Cys-tRNA synthase)